MSKDKQFRPIGFFTNIAIALLALGSVVGIQSIGKQTKATLTPQRLEEQERLRLEAIDRLPTFGYDNLLASWVFLQYIQYFGDDVRNERGYALNLPYFDAITRLDPRFVEVYPMISIGVSLYMGKPEEAIALMERGTQALSSTFEPKPTSYGGLRGWIDCCFWGMSLVPLLLTRKP
ncbi:MAG: hypothetical protein HC925_04355 [Coleofasciculaceae cyanobacterium SM2_3_26]|nr:hypothetical protein [Coleofasciculaceae cyanobacterium SM2_3_26]